MFRATIFTVALLAMTANAAILNEVPVIRRLGKNTKNTKSTKSPTTKSPTAAPTKSVKKSSKKSAKKTNAPYIIEPIELAPSTVVIHVAMVDPPSLNQIEDDFTAATLEVLDSATNRRLENVTVVGDDFRIVTNADEMDCSELSTSPAVDSECFQVVQEFNAVSSSDLTSDIDPEVLATTTQEAVVSGDYLVAVKAQGNMDPLELELPDTGAPSTAPSPSTSTSTPLSTNPPTESPSAAPSAAPSAGPSAAPSASPSASPSSTPSSAPSAAPTSFETPTTTGTTTGTDTGTDTSTSA